MEEENQKKIKNQQAYLSRKIAFPRAKFGLYLAFFIIVVILLILYKDKIL